jgi:hypothetical protein
VSYRPHLETRVLRQMRGLPDDAFDTLVRILARVCTDPHDRLFSVPVTTDGRERMAELGDSGFITFAVDEDHGLVRVLDLVWTG